MKQNLDFLVIGATKAATTTLHEILKLHPDIFLPAAKEVPFFNDDQIYKKGLNWYMDTYFKKASPDQELGTVTPQYMSGLGETTPEIVASRIYSGLPEVKIIAILRHPIYRSFSHFKMSSRRGYAKDTYDNAVRSLLSKDLDRERNNLNTKNKFLLVSEYGRILKPYYNIFNPEQILIIYDNEFKSDPSKVLAKIFNFIGVNPNFSPPNLNTKHHVGGGMPKSRLLTPGFLYKIPFVRFAWTRLVPHRLQKTINNKIGQWNIKPDSAKLSQNDSIYQELVDFYRPDIKELEKITNTKVPWKDWE